MEALNILVVEDQQYFRDGYVSVLPLKINTNKIHTAENGKIAIDILQDNSVDLVFLDISMPVMNGIQALEIIRRDFPHIKIIILSQDLFPVFVLDAYNKGAHGYLLKDGVWRDVKDAVETVMAGKRYFSENLMEIIKRYKDLPREEDFTDREAQVLEGIIEAKPTKQIAQELGIAEKTVKVYKDRLKKKTESKNIIELILYAVKNNIFKRP